MTERQIRFLDDVFARPDESQGAIYREHWPNASKKQARTEASRIVRSEQGRQYLERKRKALAVRAEHSEDEIVRGLAELAFYDPGDIFNDHWDVKALSEIPPHARRAITAIKPTAGGMFSVTLANRTEALDKLAKLMGMHDTKPEDKEAGVLEQLFKLIQEGTRDRTGRPGTLKIDMAVAAQTKFDAEE